MPDETSFPDRIGRAEELQVAIAGFDPPFDPQDPNLGAIAFESYIGSVEEANENVSTAEAAVNPLIQDRSTATDELKAKALRVKDFVTSVSNWKKFHITVSRAADKVRGYRPPKKPVVTPPGGTTPPPKPPGKGARSQQGYRDIERLFKKLIEAVEKVTGYTAPALSGLTLAELTTQHGTYETLNDTIATKEGELEEAQRTRKDFYDGENGLADKMKSIKKAVRAQYGATSTQWASVKNIRI